MKLHESTLELIERNGIKKSFIANKLGISNSLFTMFIQGKQPLQKPKRVELETLIDSYKN